MSAVDLMIRPSSWPTMQLEAIEGDLTRETLDAIVNAANSTLLGGGGVDGAIHAAAGPALLEECRQLRRTTYRDGLPVGQAVATGAGDLPAHWVIHTVGPNRNRGQDDPAQLASCFTASLEVAVQVGARSVAFPAISAGAYGWDVGDVARIAVESVRRWGGSPPEGAAVSGQGANDRVDLVRFVLFGDHAYAAFQAALES